MQKKYLYALIVIIVIAVAGLAVYFVLPNWVTTDEEYSTAALNARKLFDENNFDQTIAELERILPLAPTAEAESVAKITLAYAYRQKNNIAKSMQLFKEVVADDTYPPLYRARGASIMADIFMIGTRGPNDLADTIFSGEPYAFFLESAEGKSKATRLLDAARKLYEYASSFYILPSSEYRVAEWYASRALISKLYGAELAKPLEDYIKNAKLHLLRGDEALARALDVDGHPNKIGYSYGVRGTVFAVLHELEPMSGYAEKADKSFEDSLSFLEIPGPGGEDASNITGQRLWASFAYASFLYRLHDKSREEEIKSLTTFISDASFRSADDKSKSRFGLIRYLIRLNAVKIASDVGDARDGIAGTYPGRYDYENAKNLATLDPNFAGMLKDLGWEL
ncbi:MAG: hypothetical protein Q7S12_01885 [bacterium]|nr:hypothetical protein [bacterium]